MLNFFTKTLALSCQKDRKDKYKYACGLMTKQTLTHPCVGAYEISCLRKKVVVAGVACINGFFWGDAEKSGARVCSGCVECGGSYPHSFSFIKGECDIWAGERLVAGVKFAVVGGIAAASGSAGGGR